MPVSTTNKALPAKEPKKRSFREFAIRNRYIWLSFLIPFVLMATALTLPLCHLCNLTHLSHPVCIWCPYSSCSPLISAPQFGQKL